MTVDAHRSTVGEVATTPNGNPVITTPRTTGRFPRLRSWTIPGTGKELLLIDGARGFLLVHCALWWHERVEPINTGILDDWGWAARKIPGTSEWSEHAGGTAVDLNATQHPLGVSIWKTFPAWQVVRIRTRMRFYKAVLRWGGEWDRPDGMHVEVNASLSRCETVAKALTRTPRGKRVLAANPGAKAVIYL